MLKGRRFKKFQNRIKQYRCITEVQPPCIKYYLPFFYNQNIIDGGAEKRVEDFWAERREPTDTDIRRTSSSLDQNLSGYITSRTHTQLMWSRLSPAGHPQKFSWSHLLQPATGISAENTCILFTFGARCTTCFFGSTRVWPPLIHQQTSKGSLSQYRTIELKKGIPKVQENCNKSMVKTGSKIINRV